MQMQGIWQQLVSCRIRPRTVALPWCWAAELQALLRAFHGLTQPSSAESSGDLQAGNKNEFAALLQQQQGENKFAVYTTVTITMCCPRPAQAKCDLARNQQYRQYEGGEGLCTRAQGTPITLDYLCSPEAP
ncbi:hypothetical protein Anapl_00641 [Anas platyrhynchos]|uniref:Uncharacterized protein n=1 Tax=Anas platyrhynchos TaxID=8839 RepID=R0LNN9_ANAPL|nr:hypothetical protein Anapl_00641 [Anas platyrhynchos]